jgi:hypothetical protein
VLEFVVEAVVELVIELVFQGGGELLIEGVARLLGAPFGRRGRQHPVAAGAGLLLLGGLLGLASWWAWPYRVVASGPFPGISLLISPLVNGLLAEALGRWRESRERPRTYLSTFWGGALFAFGMAGVRYWLMGAR